MLKKQQVSGPVSAHSGPVRSRSGAAAGMGGGSSPKAETYYEVSKFGIKFKMK